MRVYTYFDPSVPNWESQGELIRLWQRSWETHGWQARILTPRVATMHPRYRQVLKHVRSLPTVNTQAYETACYLRWLAVQVDAKVGRIPQIVHVDYDVMNYGFRPTDFPDRILPLNLTKIPCAVAMPRSRAEQVIDWIEEYKPAGVTHCSDMHLFIDRAENPTSKWDIVREYGDAGWETADLVHFSNSSVVRTGSPSKVAAILACGRSGPC